jgi:HlyD family secretion protein
VAGSEAEAKKNRKAPTMPRSRLVCLISLALPLAACQPQARDSFPGYAEADYVRLAAPLGGTLAKLYLKRGDAATASAPAFVLEQQSETAAREEAEQKLQHAKEQLQNLQKGKRPDEIAALEAQHAQAQAALTLSSNEFKRISDLVAQHFNSPASLDQARATLASDQAHVRDLDAQLRLARQGSRPNEIQAAEADVRTAQAQLEQAQWKVEQKTQRVPVAADVVDLLYQQGEYVPPGAPVVTLLPPEQIKARFFVPQAVLGTLALGQQVQLACDGCGAPLAAKVSFIAREAEYTAPIIYSQENRATLVFMVEARPAPADARRLHPGQPLEVRLARAAAKP